MFQRIPILGTAVLLSLLGAAHATPTCVATLGSIDPPTIFNNGGAWEISFTATGSAHSSVLVTAASNEPIAFVHATTNTTGAYRTNLTVNGPSIANASKVGGSGEFWVTAITTSGNIGIVTATEIVSLSAGGSITGAVTAATNIGVIGATDDISGDVTAALIFQITAGDDVTGDVTSTSTATGITDDGIDSLSAGGDITGAITSHRRIGTISAGGIIGVPCSPPSPIDITMTSSGGVEEITAKSIYAEIDLNSGGGEIQRLITTGTGAGGFTGEFTGSLTCSKIIGNGVTYGLDVRGDLHADVDHHTQVMATNFRIWGSLVGDILLPAAGATHQTTINNGNDGGLWTGDVKLNGTAITHDSYGVYTVTAASLGFGSVGLAPFYFHPEGCQPVNFAVVPDSFYDPEWIGEGDPPCAHHFTDVYIRHFGPVFLDLAEDLTKEYTIKRRWAGSDGSWGMDEAADYTFGVSALNGGILREVHITRDINDGLWDAGYEYKIDVAVNMAEATSVFSAEVTGTPPVPVYSYSFTILDDCPDSLDMLYDQNGDHLLTAEDIEAWPGANPDVDANSEVTAFDRYKLFWGYLQRQNLP